MEAHFLTDSDFELFSAHIYEQSGIFFTNSNRAVLESRLRAILRGDSAPTPREYYEILVSDKKETERFLDSVTTNLTSFFRHSAQFDVLKNIVIPEISAAKRNSINKIFRVWCAGCSTGEEAYSLAMIFSENLNAPFDFQIVASDLSFSSLDVAKKGFYSAEKCKDIPADFLKKYAAQKDDGFEMSQKIKERINFAYHNLKTAPIWNDFDIVFCRNVIIYFDEKAQRDVIQKFYNAMSKNSYLFLGHSESLVGTNASFNFMNSGAATFYKKV